MQFTKSRSDRRQFLHLAATVAACLATPVLAQPGKASAAPRSVTIAQLMDVSQAQQDVSKDFLIGSRAAWQDINLQGGIHGRWVEHLAFEIDGTPASVRTALKSVKNNLTCAALRGRDRKSTRLNSSHQ